MENPDTTGILQLMTDNVQTIGLNFQLLQSQMSRLMATDALTADGTDEIQKIREKFRSHQMKAAQEVLNLKAMVERIGADVKARLRSEIKDHVQTVIREETETQIKKQITGYIPIPLDKQIAETRKQLNDVRIALRNSEARVQNSSLDMNSEYEPMASVFTESGDRSTLYPADLGSLLSYDAESLRALLRSYGLEVDDDTRTNISRFLGFIGASNVLSEDNEN